VSYSLSLRPRALVEISSTRENYALVGHGGTFLAELEAVIDTIQAMPLRFPIIYGTVRRALLRRYPFAVFFRLRPATSHIAVLAVLPQRGDPAKWPRR
jgi:plasmid stabilization system protein ParE